VSQQLGLLKSWSPSERRDAVVELARMADKDKPKIVTALIQAVVDPDPQVRLAAVGGLHVLSPNDPQMESATAALIPALSDSDPRVRATAAGILATFKPPTPGTIAGLIAATRADEASEGTAASPGTRSASIQSSIDRAQWRHARASAITALGALVPGDPEVERSSG
jgi:HEAT repeat protein